MKKTRKNKAFTLIEILISTAVLGIFFVGAMDLFVGIVRIFTKSEFATVLNQETGFTSKFIKDKLETATYPSVVSTGGTFFANLAKAKDEGPGQITGTAATPKYVQLLAGGLPTVTFKGAGEVFDEKVFDVLHRYYHTGTGATPAAQAHELFDIYAMKNVASGLYTPAAASVDVPVTTAANTVLRFYSFAPKHLIPGFDSANGYDLWTSSISCIGKYTRYSLRWNIAGKRSMLQMQVEEANGYGAAVGSESDKSYTLISQGLISMQIFASPLPNEPPLGDYDPNVNSSAGIQMYDLKATEMVVSVAASKNFTNWGADFRTGSIMNMSIGVRENWRVDTSNSTVMKSFKKSLVGRCDVSAKVNVHPRIDANPNNL